VILLDQHEAVVTSEDSEEHTHRRKDDCGCIGIGWRPDSCPKFALDGCVNSARCSAGRANPTHLFLILGTGIGASFGGATCGEPLVPPCPVPSGKARTHDGITGSRFIHAPATYQVGNRWRGINGGDTVKWTTSRRIGGMSMTESAPVTVVASFRVSPQSRDQWWRVWTELSRMARRKAACRAFSLVSDRHDKSHCAVLSTWESAEAFNEFAREANLTWMEREQVYSQSPGRFTYFEAIPSEAGEDVSVAPAEKVLVHA
jgi:quinol monooxygenase YgiN